MLALILAALLQTVPTPEAEALGRRLAASGPLTAILPMVVEKDLAELAAERPDLSSAEKAQLLEIGRTEAKANLERLIAAMGRAYAERLSEADMRVLIAQNESPETKRWRAVEPAALMQAMGALGAIDLKKKTAAAFCTKTGKLCDRN